MEQSISNEYLKISVSNTGAELSSIKSLKTGKEYMWNANPNVWGSSAPVLFPIIGALKNNECTINNSSYTIPKHGFIRHNKNLIVSRKSDDELEFQLEYSDQTLQIYPYKFRFNISFKLLNNKIVISHCVKNLDDKPIHFALGAHPAFKCPINTNEKYEDYYLEFENEENTSTTRLSDNGLITDLKEPIIKHSQLLPLTTDLFNKDALIFTDLKSKKVSLKSSKSNQILSVCYNDFSYLGIWAKPNAPFVCIEPWIGVTDHENSDGHFLKKDGLISLPVGQEFNASFSIEIEE